MVTDDDRESALGTEGAQGTGRDHHRRQLALVWATGGAVAGGAGVGAGVAGATVGAAGVAAEADPPAPTERPVDPADAAGPLRLVLRPPDEADSAVT